MGASEMEVEYLAHACLSVRSNGVRLVTDPWLEGPTYMHAWWHFPEPAARGADLADVDYVYLTHEHGDHFHPPTLAALRRDVEVLVGRYFTPRFRAQLEALGFRRVRELPHGEPVTLRGGLTVESHQFRADDTALLLRDRSAVVLNLNDCLLRDASLRRVRERHPRIDLLTVAFANAEGYPLVYDFDDAADSRDWNDSVRFDDVLEKVRAVDPEAFAPFASMFCFLNPEQRWLNARVVTPSGLLARADAGEVRAKGLGFNPGDRWTPSQGWLRRSAVDWSQKEALLRERFRCEEPRLAALRAREVPPPREELAGLFRRSFTAWSERVPWPLRRDLELRVCFEASREDGAQPLWLTLHRGRARFEAPSRPEDYQVAIRLPAWVLAQVLLGRETWQSLAISCRHRVHLRPGARALEARLWLLLFLDDLGYLSPRAFATPRALGVLWRRRLELYSQLRRAGSAGVLDAAMRDKYLRRAEP